MLNALVDASLRYKVLVLVAFGLWWASGSSPIAKCRLTCSPMSRPRRSTFTPSRRGSPPRTSRSCSPCRSKAPWQAWPRSRSCARSRSSAFSYVGVYFEDDVDIGNARRLVGEKLQEVKGRLPAGYGEREKPGPNSSGLGQVFWYTIEDADRSSRRWTGTLHDWTVRLILRTAPGVDDVTTWGGHEKQFQVQIDPQRLVKYAISFKDVMEQLAANNKQVGGQYLNIGPYTWCAG